MRPQAVGLGFSESRPKIRVPSVAKKTGLLRLRYDFEVAAGPRKMLVGFLTSLA